MSLTAAMIDAMIASGCSAEQMAAVVKADIAEREQHLAGKRKKDAVRQQKSRGNRKMSRDVTVTCVTSRDPSLDKERSPTPPKEIKPIQPPETSDEVSPPNFPVAENDDQPLTVDELVDDWNEFAAEHGLPIAAKLTESRRRRAAARIRQYPEIESWQRAFATIRGSPWLRGANDRGWRADFDFLLQDKSFTKLVEGSYGSS